MRVEAQNGLWDEDLVAESSPCSQNGRWHSTLRIARDPDQPRRLRLSHTNRFATRDSRLRLVEIKKAENQRWRPPTALSFRL